MWDNTTNTQRGVHSIIMAAGNRIGAKRGGAKRGGAKRRQMTQEEKEQAAQNLAPWNRYVKKFREVNPELSLRDALKHASKSKGWQQIKAGKTVDWTKNKVGKQ